MPNFRIQIPNAHFHKHWHDSAAHKGRIVTWHNQAARKHRRRENRLAKAIKNFPRPVNGLLRPVVHCQTIRYNMKKRAGKGFTLEELKAAKVNRREARSIGISVDHRRKNRSEQSLKENVTRLETYKANLIVFPKKCNRKKPQKGDSSKDACSKAEQVIGDVMPIIKPKPVIVPYKITEVCCTCSHKTLNVCEDSPHKTHISSSIMRTVQYVLVLDCRGSSIPRRSCCRSLGIAGQQPAYRSAALQ
jgi:large subunit ribosomal protein L13e